MDNTDSNNELVKRAKSSKQVNSHLYKEVGTESPRILRSAHQDQGQQPKAQQQLKLKEAQLAYLEAEVRKKEDEIMKLKAAKVDKSV